jgi:hypothetical protein
MVPGKQPRIDVGRLTSGARANRSGIDVGRLANGTWAKRPGVNVG